MPLLHSYVSPTETGFSFSSAWSAFFFLLTSDLNWIYALWIYHLSLSGVGSSGIILQQTCTMAPLVHKGHPNKCISSTSSWLQFLPQIFCSNPPSPKPIHFKISYGGFYLELYARMLTFLLFLINILHCQNWPFF